MMERHHGARQAAQQAFLEALERLRENLTDPEDAAALDTVETEAAPSPQAAAETAPPANQEITLEDLEAAIEDIERYMDSQHQQDEDPQAPANPEDSENSENSASSENSKVAQGEESNRDHPLDQGMEPAAETSDLADPNALWAEILLGLEQNAAPAPPPAPHDRRRSGETR
ncbi:hypothetical protein [Limnothrix redekei]|uniref:Uncharacterized protein n=1 Tax=Limnothrix redekei LRLZ20PSL1 TaxID=3112953 RepID=A0ABW7CBU0_9CYAN